MESTNSIPSIAFIPQVSSIEVLRENDFQESKREFSKVSFPELSKVSFPEANLSPDKRDSSGGQKSVEQEQAQRLAEVQ